MSLGKRLALIFRSKANRALDRAEDPRETLDYSYQQQLELLQKVRRGLADVATSRKRLELQARQLSDGAGRLQSQAAQAMAAGREDLAREALTRRAAAQQQLDELEAQRQALAAEEAKLTDASQRLQTKVEVFRTRKESIKATYTAAEAQTRIGEAVSGLSEEMSDVGLAMQRAEDKTAQMQARAGAIDDLIASGALEDATSSTTDDIQVQLNRMESQGNVVRELAALRASVPAGAQGQARALSAAPTTPPEQAPEQAREQVPDVTTQAGVGGGQS